MGERWGEWVREFCGFIQNNRKETEGFVVEAVGLVVLSVGFVMTEVDEGERVAVKNVMVVAAIEAAAGF